MTKQNLIIKKHLRYRRDMFSVPSTWGMKALPMCVPSIVLGTLPEIGIEKHYSSLILEYHGLGGFLVFLPAPNSPHSTYQLINRLKLGRTRLVRRQNKPQGQDRDTLESWSIRMDLAKMDKNEISWNGYHVKAQITNTANVGTIFGHYFFN